ncbi:hypothetical protein PYCCODRAFT_1428489 [Trametes coccinea BRFM310]|uniref:Uncharacterized protein n=1 Tax=Trametes coccinea (strain BRFM310) TaxID=1353009 RepID=A0A1Y2I8K3_TRAC3|nr:hypothetical protein PYCCODRAFT_1428489 [Trametes coccinea BRFM310]
MSGSQPGLSRIEEEDDPTSRAASETPPRGDNPASHDSLGSNEGQSKPAKRLPAAFQKKRAGDASNERHQKSVKVNEQSTTSSQANKKKPKKLSVPPARTTKEAAPASGSRKHAKAVQQQMQQHSIEVRFLFNTVCACGLNAKHVVQGMFHVFGGSGQIASPYAGPSGATLQTQYSPFPIPYPPQFQFAPMFYPAMPFASPLSAGQVPQSHQLSTPTRPAPSKKALGKQPAREPSRSSRQAKKPSVAIVEEDDPMTAENEDGEDDEDEDGEDGEDGEDEDDEDEDEDEDDEDVEDEDDEDVEDEDDDDDDAFELEEDPNDDGGGNNHGEDEVQQEDVPESNVGKVIESGAESDNNSVGTQREREEVEDELTFEASEKEGDGDLEEGKGKKESTANVSTTEAEEGETATPRKPSSSKPRGKGSSSSGHSTIGQEKQSAKRRATGVEHGVSQSFALTILDRVQGLADSMSERDEQNREYQQRMIGTVKKLSQTVAEMQRRAPVIVRRQVKTAVARRQREPRGMLSRIIMDGQSSSMSLEEKAALAQNEKAHLKQLQDLQKVVRAHVAHLLGFKGKDYATMVRRNPPLTDDEIKQYEETTSANYFARNRFRLDFTRSPTAFAFNVEARDYFIRHLKRSVQGGSYKKAEIPERYLTEDHIGSAFDTYMETCREHYRLIKKPLSEAESRRRKQRARMNARKSTALQLYVTRESVVIDKKWTRHLDLFALLNPEDMSGDETERDEEGHKSDEYRTFMRALDDWHYHKRYNEDEQTGGNGPRTRKPREKVAEAEATTGNPQGEATKVKVPRGLYRNCYSSTYLKTLKPYQRRALDVIDEDYDFTLPALGAEDVDEDDGKMGNSDEVTIERDAGAAECDVEEPLRVRERLWASNESALGDPSVTRE